MQPVNSAVVIRLVGEAGPSPAFRATHHSLFRQSFWYVHTMLLH